MAKKSAPVAPITEYGNVATTLGKGTHFHGILEFDRPLQINGRFDGEIKTTGTLIIGEGAEIKANIQAETVIVGGEVTGNIEARTKLEMLTSGRVYGNIRTAKLQIADGVIFDGTCEMIEES